MAAVVTGGLAYIKINGAQVYMRGSCKIKMGSFKNAAIANQDGSVVFTKTPAVPMISLNISDYGTLSLQALTQLIGVTLAATLVNGKTYTLVGATYLDESELNTEDGSFPINFGGSNCNEQVAAS